MEEGAEKGDRYHQLMFRPKSRIEEFETVGFGVGSRSRFGAGVGLLVEGI